MSTPDPAEDGVVATYYKAPLASRAVCSITAFVYLASLILVPGLPYGMMCCPLKVAQLQVWRLILAPLATPSLIGVLIGIFVFVQIGFMFERKYGSLGFAYLFFLFGAVANVLFSVAAILLAPMAPGAGFLSQASCAGGLWGSMLAFLVVQTQRSTQPTTSFWGMCNIPTKLYPLFLVVLFSLLGSPILENLCALLAGYLFHHGYLSRFLPKGSTFTSWEANPNLNMLTSAPGYLTW
eukprot:CAMPEP_0206230762 /NCGR_PEP_ID=MMETSP0047_2-20121206/10449_1 /ASSEMBLY_ACC=CAM_ASM_000192 /TAXON_ID=195065 /ORGANISM="Chroomonas mesostigmatica_cf, Strain CCMP1168" /LENGTH=236 /DNA_ID=CAMNT_0053654241 /DNA_START=29 /DNA_END=736 /DNA_ORIENTATION=-